MPAPALGVTLDFTGADALVAKLRERASDMSPALRPMVDYLRRGPQGFAAQISRRTCMHLDASRPWQEPHYARGGLPAAARAGEQPLWDAALGGAGSGQTVTRNTVRCLVFESVVAARSASLGNGVISTAGYFADVTGGWFQRQVAALLRAVKPANLNKWFRGARSGEKRPKVSGITAFTRLYAMFWKVAFTFGYSLTEAELRSGVSTPPKNLGIPSSAIEHFKGLLVDHLLGAGSLARGRANDPRGGR